MYPLTNIINNTEVISLKSSSVFSSNSPISLPLSDEITDEPGYLKSEHTDFLSVIKDFLDIKFKQLCDSLSIPSHKSTITDIKSTDYSVIIDITIYNEKWNTIDMKSELSEKLNTLYKKRNPTQKSNKQEKNPNKNTIQETIQESNISITYEDFLSIFTDLVDITDSFDLHLNTIMFYENIINIEMEFTRNLSIYKLPIELIQNIMESLPLKKLKKLPKYLFSINNEKDKLMSKIIEKYYPVIPKLYKLFREKYPDNLNDPFDWFELLDQLENTKIDYLYHQRFALDSYNFHKLDGTSIPTNRIIRLASLHGRYHIVDLLLMDEGIDPTDKDHGIIKYACKQGHIKVVKRLLTFPEINPGTDSSISLYDAVIGQHTEIVQMLLEHGVANPTVNNYRCISLAANSRHIPILKLLLKDTRTDFANNNLRSSILRKASKQGYYDIIIAFFECGKVNLEKDTFVWYLLLKNDHISIITSIFLYFRQHNTYNNMYNSIESYILNICINMSPQYIHILLKLVNPTMLEYSIFICLTKGKYDVAISVLDSIENIYSDTYFKKIAINSLKTLYCYIPDRIRNVYGHMYYNASLSEVPDHIWIRIMKIGGV